MLQFPVTPSMIYKRLSAFGMSALLSIAVLAYAQEEPTEEAPPAELSQEEIDWQNRIVRAEGFRTKMLQTSRGVELFHTFVEKNKEQIAANRSKCAEDLRRANRDTLFSTTMNCYRKELLLDTDLAEKKRQFAETISGVSDEQRENTLAAIDSLLEAMEAIASGIETGVFHNKEELIEAKQNLHENYRVPVLTSMIHMDADRKLTWIAHLMVRLLVTTQNMEMGPEAFEKAAEALNCYAEEESSMATIQETEGYTDALFLIDQSRTQLRTCGVLLSEAHSLQEAFEQGQEAVLEEENS
jgi:hypothetical protein